MQMSKLAAAMLLDHVGQREAGERIRAAVEQVAGHDQVRIAALPGECLVEDPGTLQRPHHRVVSAVHVADGDDPVDVVLDVVGGEEVNRNLAVVRPQGTIIQVGLMGGNQTSVNLGLLLVKRVRWVGTTLRARPLEQKIEVRPSYGLTAVARGRLDGHALTNVRDIFVADAWSTTAGHYGSRLLFDQDGYLYIEGRADDTIIRGGENIAPAEIETVLEAHPAIAEACVVGLPDDEWGQRIVAAVVLTPDAAVDDEELRRAVESELRSSKTPERILFVDALPRTDTGKLLRRAIVEQLQNAP